MHSDQSLLPNMPIFGIIGALPESYAGVISATLRRFSAFSEMTDRSFTILTKSKTTRPAAIESLLHSQNRLDPRITVRNVWTDLQSWSDAKLRSLLPVEESSFDEKASLAEEDVQLARGELKFDERSRKDAKGRILQTTRYRPEGTIAFTDRLDTQQQGRLGGRRLTIFDRQENALYSWSSATGLYHAWLDSYTGGNDSLLINDSSEFGAVISSYRRDNVTTIQVLHSDYPERIGHRELSAGKFTTLTRLDWFDLIAVLTETQIADLRTRGIVRQKGNNIASAPNIVDTPVITELGDRSANRGIYVGRLAKEKRVDHAIQATSNARNSGTAVNLDIYGGGPLFAELNSLVDDLGATEAVRFHGHVNEARNKFLDASFSILSSRSESFALVVVESMARGCIPIAYDIAFGPATIITHGVDGFLVPPGDVNELANTISHVATLEEAQLAAMRRAAITRAQDFSATSATRQWGDLLHHAVEGKRGASTKESVSATISSAHWRDPSTLTITGDFTASHDGQPEDLLLSWIGRNSESYGRVSPKDTDSGSSQKFEFDIPIDRMGLRIGDACDIHLDCLVDSHPVRTRLKVDNSSLPKQSDNFRPYSTRYGNFTISMEENPECAPDDSLHP